MSFYFDSTEKAKVPYKALTPKNGVRLNNGILKEVFDNNIKYLLKHYTLDDILFRFRERAGIQNPPGRPVGWEQTALLGSVAGLFMMGAGNSLRWVENAELTERINKVIDEIELYKKTNGFIMAYKEEEALNSSICAENSNYVRSWVTHGLLDAGIAGNTKAFELIRKHQDWFNNWDELKTGKPSVRDRHTGFQGMASIARMYFAPGGKIEDIETLQNYYQEDWWLDMFIDGNDKAVYRRDDKYDWWDFEQEYKEEIGAPPECISPNWTVSFLSFPHGYEITGFEAYLDLYRATGDLKYLHAMNSAWEMYRDKWEHVGGSIAMCELREFKPKSYFLGIGELCCAVFWIEFNQRFHLLYPDAEVYVSEIEKSLYNACISSQYKDEGIIYHSTLHGRRSLDKAAATCCEGQGTRVFGSIPEYLYSLSNDGIYVDIYAPSIITWNQEGQDITLTNITDFPDDENVKLVIQTEKSKFFTLNLRIPAWVASENVEININGINEYIGKPGSYFKIHRKWENEDSITLKLSKRFETVKLEGEDVLVGYDRYAVKIGPILLAVVGEMDVKNCLRYDESATESKGDFVTFTKYVKKYDYYEECIKINADINDIEEWLIPVNGKPMHYTIKDKPGYEFMPYYKIKETTFTCFPIFDYK